MRPWYDPQQLFVSLGITLPFFIYYCWRFYSSVADHRDGMKILDGDAWLGEILLPKWNEDQISSQLAMSHVSAKVDTTLMSIRRRMIFDSNILVLLGFIGTLLGLLTSFENLSFANNEPLSAIGKITGGLGTAVVSSLAAAILAIFERGYLAGTEKAVASLKKKIIKKCFQQYTAVNHAPQQVLSINDESRELILPPSRSFQCKSMTHRKSVQSQRCKLSNMKNAKKDNQHLWKWQFKKMDRV